MRLKELLHKLFLDAANFIDKRIHKTLLLAVEALAINKKLSISHIGRVLTSKAKIKHNIKRIDRLVGNTALHEDFINYYKQIAKILLAGNNRPIIIIDWAVLTQNRKFWFMRAAIVNKGRAIPILDLVFPEDALTSPESHKKFLILLKSILPEQCKPIIVTDAGFRCTWFKLVNSFCWDFVSRARHKTLFKKINSNNWGYIKDLYIESSSKAKFLFTAFLAKANPVVCNFYIFKGSKKHRIHKNLNGSKARGSASRKIAKREDEPWLIVTSLSNNKYQPHDIINIYKKRMQIEESFRDLKNTDNGFSLRLSRTFEKNRLNILLLIGAIAAFFLHIIGIAAIQNNLHYSFQSNTNKRTTVLSCVTIGWQILKLGFYKITYNSLKLALEEVITYVSI